MRNFFKSKPEGTAVNDLFKMAGLEELATLIGIFPDGMDDDVFDFSTVELDDPGPDEIFVMNLEMPEVILHSLNFNCKLKFEKLKKEFDELQQKDPSSEMSKELGKKLLSYATIGNAAGMLMQARTNLLVISNDIDIPPGYSLATRAGFELYAEPMNISPVIVLSLDDMDEETLKEIFGSLETDDSFEEMAKNAGVRLSTKDIGTS